MFLKSDYRDRAIGLIAAFAVLITGAITTGAIAPPAVKAIDAMPRTSPSYGRPEAKRADDCSSGLRCKCDTYC